MIGQLRQEPWVVALLAALLAVFAAMAAHRAGRAILRRVFHRVMRIAPAEYRQRFSRRARKR